MHADQNESCRHECGGRCGRATEWTKSRGRLFPFFSLRAALAFVPCWTRGRGVGHDRSRGPLMRALVLTLSAAIGLAVAAAASQAAAAEVYVFADHALHRFDASSGGFVGT